ncbi:putative wd tetratricopeptide repeat domain-containing protein [Botrytis fragariae]|uniref:Putative wd tetratricopeptide repeat domain-containing protein n=1 Tax=Botrytis fragariae TaxID=1964551 RepID=A0A8H6ATM8_9HELO|nr:putative wd tetratricopeptide repeat domain-containing protein [Botrytis fragariae]KAF5873412.1 putative wd tetratricopeptide repeat domain-containing protein [Botrytis fragariae]
MTSSAPQYSPKKRRLVQPFNLDRPLSYFSYPKDHAQFHCTMDGDSDLEDDTSIFVGRRHELTERLEENPYDLLTYLERASVYSDLGYPDLASGDSYKALLLCDELKDESFEYHEQALEAFKSRLADGFSENLLKRHVPGLADTGNVTETIERSGIERLNLDEVDEDVYMRIADKAALRCYQNLSLSLLLCGCLKSAYDFCSRGLKVAPDDEELSQVKDYIFNMAKRRLKTDEVDISELPDQGLVRREIYPWNDHEPNRFSEESLDFLNQELQAISSKVEVRAVELPTLVEAAISQEEDGHIPTNKQLGLFATNDIQPGETVLEETSVLTVNNRLKDALCDACSTVLPPLGKNSTVVGCPDCYDIMFCNETCLNLALETYHPAICEKDVDTISKDPDPKESPNALYLLLLARALAMSATQEVHPLDLKEVKFIWGDFLDSASNAVPISPKSEPPPVWTLPFSFSSNIATPLHILEKMDIDIFAEIANYDLWILNTLYSKFRGTASARVNTSTGMPEVAAVHPLWCLANHDCDPNVQWEWGGRMKLWCREKRINGKGGVKKGEEIWNHYCDIELPVQERREWAEGSLGGWCMCERCRRESGEIYGEGENYGERENYGEKRLNVFVDVGENSLTPTGVEVDGKIVENGYVDVKMPLSGEEDVVSNGGKRVTE